MSAVGLLSRRDFFCFTDFSYRWNTNLRILKQKKKKNIWHDSVAEEILHVSHKNAN